MGCDDCEEESLQLNVLQNQVFVHLNSGRYAGFSVKVSRAGKVVQSRLEGELVVRVFVMLLGFVDKRVHLVLEQGVKEVILWSRTEVGLIFDLLLAPFSKSEET